MVTNEGDRFGLHMANHRFNRQKDPQDWNNLFAMCSELYTQVTAWDLTQPPLIRAFSNPIKATLYAFDMSCTDTESTLTEEELLCEWMADVMTRRHGYLAVADFLAESILAAIDHEGFDLDGNYGNN